MSEPHFPVLAAMRLDVAHPVDPWGGALRRLLEVIDGPGTVRKLFTNTPFGRHLSYRATWRGETYPPLWLEGRTFVARDEDGRDHEWPVGALLASAESGPALGLSTVELVLMRPDGVVVPLPGRAIVDWRPFLYSDDAGTTSAFPTNFAPKTAC